VKSTVYKLDPLVDARWPLFLSGHSQASIFHTREWLQALKKTYGYVPVAFTTSSPEEELKNAVVFCHVKSWLTGSRLVSLPFSDHCQPLAGSADLSVILESLEDRRVERFKYIELRPLSSPGGMSCEKFVKSDSFSFHKVDLRPGLDEIYKTLHDSCIRRKIKRAEREKVTYEAGHSEELLQKFRRLLLLTRRRHKLPPQPAEWFRNLASCFRDALTIHVASKENIPVASIITLSSKNSLVYKYGCSDSKYSNLGGTPFLFWKAIQEGKRQGAEEFDLGRSGPDDPGLIAFKEHLGGIKEQLSYYRHPAGTLHQEGLNERMSWAKQVLVRLPDPVFSSVGRLYRHLG
jgi:Acetyltransferase (GNAT) domain